MPLARVYYEEGRWEEAEKLFMQVMETGETKLSDDHPDTLTSMADLASTYL
ncbi:Kinesin light chain [Aspergillus sclerotialis]|uniref:Kinesin light chain n=1 Tax=Aspergillus sclerotialis TaxID=2070753 RepID=A0A3A2ZDY1_9EURO|nr:Kinesin light chain [Aspergillus sclerotialis]